VCSDNVNCPEEGNLSGRVSTEHIRSFTRYLGAKALIRGWLKEARGTKSGSQLIDLHELLQTAPEETLILRLRDLLRSRRELKTVVRNAFSEYLSINCCILSDEEMAHPTERSLIEVLNVLEYLLDHRNSSPRRAKWIEIGEQTIRLREALRLLQIINDLDDYREPVVVLDRFSVRRLPPKELRRSLAEAQYAADQLQLDYGGRCSSWTALARYNCKRNHWDPFPTSAFVAVSWIYDLLETAVPLLFRNLRRYVCRNEPCQLYVERRRIEELTRRLKSPPNSERS